MTRCILRAPAILTRALVLTTATALAQVAGIQPAEAQSKAPETAPGTAPPPRTSGDAARPGEAQPGEAPADAPTGDGGDTAAGTAAGQGAAANKRSPFDYRSSEQISEDLSVSFPVDI